MIRRAPYLVPKTANLEDAEGEKGEGVQDQVLTTDIDTLATGRACWWPWPWPTLRPMSAEVLADMLAAGPDLALSSGSLQQHA